MFKRITQFFSDLASQKSKSRERNKNIKNIFIYDALPEDKITINKRPVRISDKPIEFDNLRIIFTDDYKQAKAAGVEERIDAAFLNAADIRELGQPYVFQMLGRARYTCLEIGQ